MNYLDSSEYGQYGLDASLPEWWVTAASALIDAHCRRKSLGVAQYSERMRVASARNTARLTYLPLSAVAPALSPIVSARARFAVPRRGEGVPELSEFAQDVAEAFRLPGDWTSLDPSTLEVCAETGEITLGIHPLGLTFNEVEVA